MKLLLFDIDLTLITSGGAGRTAMSVAFKKVFGFTNGLEKITFSGRTDELIFKDGLKQHGIEWSEERRLLFKQAYLQQLQIEIKRPNVDKRILPGVIKLLDNLMGRQDVTLALLTGNWSEGARLKLEHFDLFHYFVFGAFADDSEIRENLPEIAAGRFFDLAGCRLSPRDVFVIGDTTRDIACAQPFGATSVAVATGLHSFEMLESAQPDFLFKDLSDTRSFLNILD